MEDRWSEPQRGAIGAEVAYCHRRRLLDSRNSQAKKTRNCFELPLLGQPHKPLASSLVSSWHDDSETSSIALSMAGRVKVVPVTYVNPGEIHAHVFRKSSLGLRGWLWVLLEFSFQYIHLILTKAGFGLGLGPTGKSSHGRVAVRQRIAEHGVG